MALLGGRCLLPRRAASGGRGTLTDDVGAGGTRAGRLGGANNPFPKKKKNFQKPKTEKTILRRFKGVKILWWYSCSFSW